MRKANNNGIPDHELEDWNLKGAQGLVVSVTFLKINFNPDK